MKYVMSGVNKQGNSQKILFHKTIKYNQFNQEEVISFTPKFKKFWKAKKPLP